jgi:hypothetical protein
VSRLSDILSQMMSTRRSNTACNKTLQHTTRGRPGKSHFDVDVLFGAGLEKLDAQLLGKLFAPFETYHSFVFHVAFVAHEDHLGVVPRVRLDLGHPGIESRTETRAFKIVIVN